MSPELRDQLEAFVCGRISLGALRDWLVPRFPDEDQIECEIYCQVEMALQHIRDGYGDDSEEDIRGKLSPYLIERETSSANRTLRTRWGAA